MLHVNCITIDNQKIIIFGIGTFYLKWLITLQAFLFYIIPSYYMMVYTWKIQFYDRYAALS